MPLMVSLLQRCTYWASRLSRHEAGSGNSVYACAALLAARRVSQYLPASLNDFWLQLPVTTKSTAPPRERFSGTMAFSARPPPCMNRMRKWAGTASSSRRSDSAASMMDLNSLPRWLISITLMPLPCQSSISAAACCSTSAGMAAGPAEKL
ncbi:hypothetical protein D9M69_553530 [compost metagenome]